MHVVGIGIELRRGIGRLFSIDGAELCDACVIVMRGAVLQLQRLYSEGAYPEFLISPAYDPNVHTDDDLVRQILGPVPSYPGWVGGLVEDGENPPWHMGACQMDIDLDDI